MGFSVFFFLPNGLSLKARRIQIHFILADLSQLDRRNRLFSEDDFNMKRGLIGVNPVLWP
jgi:hypothetical protein